MAKDQGKIISPTGSNPGVLLGKGKNDLSVSLSEIIDDGVVIFDQTGKIIFSNSALEKMLDINRDGIIGGNYINQLWRLKPDSGSEESIYRRLFDEILETGNTVNQAELALEIAGGKNLRASITAAPYHDENGNAIGVVWAVADVAKQNQLRKELKCLREDYERLLGYTNEIILRARTEDCGIIAINAAGQKILGYSLADFQADPLLFTRLILPEYLASWQKTVEEIKQGKEAIDDIVLGITTKDGREVMIAFTAVAWRDEKIESAGMELLGRDLSSHLFLERELARSQKLEAIGLLAGGIAHDFNNILTAILGTLALAKMETNVSDYVHERISMAEEQCLKAKALTSKLLTYSRSGSPLRKTTSLSQVLKDGARFAISGKNINCEFNIAEDIGSVQIDESQIHQVVHYLVTNAAEAMPNGGTIEIGAQNVNLKMGQLPPLAAGRYVRCYVKDHGVGMPEEYLKKIFDPYFTTKRLGSIKGMGLGLAICYSIIKNHDGLVLVESQPGVGTTFTVYIPAVDDERTENEEQAKIIESN